MESLRKSFIGKGNIGVFDEYMVSGIRLKNTVVALRQILDHPVHGYVLQHEEGSENPDVAVEVYSPGSDHAQMYVAMRNSFTNSVFKRDEGFHFRSQIHKSVYHRMLQRVMKSM